ncbi:hemolysin III family protein [Paenibacillus tritici]|uniref:PAQR family membrane homeostasis protein TrhA n=1 Tax=Paenibacillus tritici TaxID=1873425 RepID=UPI001BAA6CD0|nr:hemolysin III family protein [Paenibacillus tritici]QUL53424.1 hemolysin III family protein [Paenibacillus tritici]
MNAEISIKNSRLPVYSEGEETFNVYSHTLGVLFGMGMLITVALLYQNTLQLVSGILFGLSLIILYSMSCIYHGLSPEKELDHKKKFQVVDHCSIPILIAGTYAPFALCVLEPAKQGLGWTLFGIVCVIVCIVIALNILDLNRFKAITMIGYFLMGGSLLIGSDILITELTREGFAIFLAGGAAYSIGTVFYKLGGMKIKWMHSVFHVFCILGSILHGVCVCIYVFHY